MDWHNLYFGHVSPQEVQKAVKDPKWQNFRKSLKGLSLAEKYERLYAYMNEMNLSIPGWEKDQWRMVEVRITNYVTALSRGGLIKPSDYR